MFDYYIYVSGKQRFSAIIGYVFLNLALYSLWVFKIISDLYFYNLLKLERRRC